MAYIAVRPEQNGFSVGGPEAKGNLLLSKNPSAIYGFLLSETRGDRRLGFLGGRVRLLNPQALIAGPYRRPSEGPLADDDVAAVAFELRMSGNSEGVWQPSGKAGINCSSGQFYVWALDLGRQLNGDDDGVRLCADKPRVDALKPFTNPLMC